MNAEELGEYVKNNEEFQLKCWKVIADILEDKYNVKIKVGGLKDGKKD